MRCSLLELQLCGQRVLVDDDFGVAAQRLYESDEIANAVLVNELVLARVTICRGMDSGRPGITAFRL